MNNSKKTVLFDGTSLEGWHTADGKLPDWQLEDGVMTVNHGNIISNEVYGDAMLHVEFRTPDMPWASGQDKGNSGVYVHGCYEIQVLDSYGKENSDHSDCGAIYGMYEPQMNACKPAMEWQMYDIMIRAPRFNENGEVTENARMTVLQNGLVIHNNIVLPRNTPGGVYDRVVKEGPLLLQDHGNPVSFRNIWLIHLA